MLGSEAAGEVVDVGAGVTEFKRGDRVAYAAGPGCYTAERVLPADRAVKLPGDISFEQAAAMMLKGLTVQYLLRRTFKVEKGMNVLMHAAAGGVGLILCQWAKLCDVVYDGIGKDTFPASLDCIRPLGMFVSFGAASGSIEAFNINLLQTKGSLFATRPTLNTYGAKREDLLSMAADLFAVVGSGAVKIPVNQKYALRDAAKAHRDLESRATTGSSILIP